MDELQAAVEYARVQGMSDAAIARTVKAEADRRRFAEAPVDAVTMVHKTLPDQPITVVADAVVHWEAGGWTLAPRAPEPDAAQPPADEPPPDDASAKTPKTTKAKETP